VKGRFLKTRMSPFQGAVTLSASKQGERGEATTEVARGGQQALGSREQNATSLVLGTL